MIHSLCNGDISKYNQTIALPMPLVYKWHYLNRITVLNSVYSQLDRLNDE